MRFSWKHRHCLQGETPKFQKTPPLGLMRFSWKRSLPSGFWDKNCSPPLGLMRFSWKRDRTQLWSFGFFEPPPLGLMRFSWKRLLLALRLPSRVLFPPPLGLMRFSWKPPSRWRKRGFFYTPPPLGLMRFSWKHWAGHHPLRLRSPPRLG